MRGLEQTNTEVRNFQDFEQHMTKTLLSKICARADYETLIHHNPIEQLKAIKEFALSCQETKYDVSVITDSLKAFVYLKQRDNESLIDCTARFKTARDVCKMALGCIVMLKTTQQHPGIRESKE